MQLLLNCLKLNLIIETNAPRLVPNDVRYPSPW